MELVKLMIEKGANDWNNGLEYACIGGYKEIMKLMIEKGANNLQEGLEIANKYNHLEIINYLNSLN